MIISHNPAGQEEKTVRSAVSSCYSYSSATAADGIPLPCGAGGRKLRHAQGGGGM